MKRTPLIRKTGLKSGGKPMARARMKRKPPPPGFDEQTKAIVRRRSGNRCEVPGPDCMGKATHFHHRKLRGHGDHSPVNCLHVCAVDHQRIHASPAKSYLMGWMVRSQFDPAEVPIKRSDRPA